MLNEQQKAEHTRHYVIHQKFCTSTRYECQQHSPPHYQISGTNNKNNVSKKKIENSNSSLNAHYWNKHLDY